jgi:hypothetical protein
MGVVPLSSAVSPAFATASSQRIYLILRKQTKIPAPARKPRPSTPLTFKNISSRQKWAEPLPKSAGADAGRIQILSFLKPTIMKRAILIGLAITAVAGAVYAMVSGCCGGICEPGCFPPFC